jgi:hypothetical protein
LLGEGIGKAVSPVEQFLHDEIQPVAVGFSVALIA